METPEISITHIIIPRFSEAPLAELLQCPQQNRPSPSGFLAFFFFFLLLLAGEALARETKGSRGPMRPGGRNREIETKSILS